MSDTTEQWGPWTDGTWADVQAGDEIDKGERIWYVANVSNGLVDMVPSEDRAGTIRSGRPLKDAPVKYRRRTESEPTNVVTEQRPVLREIATAVLDELAESRQKSITDQIEQFGKVKHPPGTPEYERYVAELQIELTKFAKGEEPYPYVAPAPVVERAGWPTTEVITPVDEIDPVEQRVIDAAEGMPCAPAPITETEMLRAKSLSAIGERVEVAITRAVGAMAAGYVLAVIEALASLHVVVAEFTRAYAVALSELGADTEPDPDPGDMTAERAALNNLRAAGMEPLVIERVLSYPDVLKHLKEDHTEVEIPALGKRTKIEGRKELADLHFAAHENEQRVGEKWEPRGEGRPHVHPVMDRPMPPGAI